MGTQGKSAFVVSDLIAPGVFQDGAAPRYSTESGASAVAGILQSKGRAFLKVAGKSMFPWFRPRDIVFVRRADFKSLSCGDVVVFERNGCLCMHRVLSLRISGDRESGSLSAITKGDAVADADEPISAREFRGKVEFLYRNGSEIGLESLGRRLFGKFLAVISPASRFWLSPFCRLKNHLDDVTASSCKPENQPIQQKRVL
ncbi:MAG: S24 family peptidase [Candidatus Acidiferrales bacterium]